eukprot:3919480-Lingulodinium_polyedra.AAC.1
MARATSAHADGPLALSRSVARQGERGVLSADPRGGASAQGQQARAVCCEPATPDFPNQTARGRSVARQG